MRLRKGQVTLSRSGCYHARHGPEGWKLLAQELEHRRHRVLTPALDLSRADEGLIWDAETIVDALKQSGLQSSEVVGVAHSASGMYLPLVAERWPLRRMVFLAAAVPRPGVSMMDLFRADSSMLNPKWVGKNPMEDDIALEFCFHDSPPERLDWALSTFPNFYRMAYHVERQIEQKTRLGTSPD